MFFLALITNMLTLVERNYLACALRVDILGEKQRIGIFLRRSSDKILPRVTFTATNKLAGLFIFVSYTLYVYHILYMFWMVSTKIPPCESNCWGKFGGNSSFRPKLVEKSLFHQIKW